MLGSCAFQGIDLVAAFVTLGKFFAVEVPVWGEIGVTRGTLEQHRAGTSDHVDQPPDRRGDGRSGAVKRRAVYRTIAVGVLTQPLSSLHLAAMQMRMPSLP